MISSNSRAHSLEILPAIAGFVFSGVGIAVLTLIIGTLNPKGYIYDF